MEREYRHRPDFFFPILLITVGVVWLFINNGVIAVENVYRLIPYWPVLLILAGISLLIGRLWWPLSGLLWLATAAAVVWLLLNPGLLPPAPAREVREETFRVPVEGASSASVRLDLSVNPTRIYPLDDANDLIVADVSYIGDMTFEVSGTTEKTVRLDENLSINFWNFPFVNMLGNQVQPWEIGLTPEIPLALTVDAGTGRTEMDLTRLQLSSLNVDGGTGSIEISLPEPAASAGENARFPFTLDVGTGNVLVTAPEGSSFDLDVDGGTGNLVVDVADEAGVQVEVRDGGTGNLRLPTAFEKVSGDPGDDEGTWQNEAYSTAGSNIRVILDIGTGNVEIR